MMIVEGEHLTVNKYKEIRGSTIPTTQKCAAKNQQPLSPQQNDLEKPRIYARVFRHNGTGGIDGRHHATV
jgi:hypothetical protein